MMDGMARVPEGARTFIGSLDDVPWVELPDRGGQVRVKFLGESRETGPWLLYSWFAPGYREPAHRHDFDTIYLPTRGEMALEGEGVVKAGEYRWVRAGTFYGPEAAGPDGLEFWLISYGPPGYHTGPLDPVT